MNRRSILLSAAMLCLVPQASPVLAGAPLFTVAAGSGQPETPVSAEDLDKIGRKEIDTTIFVFGGETHKVKGVLMRDLAAFAGAKGENVTITALDGYSLSIPMSDFAAYDAVVATEIDGKPLSVRDRGPAWLIYPVSGHPELADTVYESRMVWQIKSMQFD